MSKFCIKCKMGDPLPHDERIGQAIYNMLRPNEGTYSTEEMIIKYKAQIADRLFNLSDHELQRMFYDRFWCDKCKEREF